MGLQIISLPSTPATVNSNATGATVNSPGTNGGVQVNVTDNSSININGSMSMFPTPVSMSQNISSAVGGGAAAKQVFFLNEDAFNATPTDNGSGPGSITNEYGDGWSGKGYTNLAYSSKDSQGMPGIQCYGFTLIFTNIATGLQDAAGINNAAPEVLIANLVGQNQIPVGMPLGSGIRNTQFKDGTMTVITNFTLNSLCQFSYVVPVGDTAALIIFCRPQLS